MRRVKLLNVAAMLMLVFSSFASAALMRCNESSGLLWDRSGSWDTWSGSAWVAAGRVPNTSDTVLIATAAAGTFWSGNINTDPLYVRSYVQQGYGSDNSACWAYCDELWLSNRPNVPRGLQIDGTLNATTVHLGYVGGTDPTYPNSDSAKYYAPVTVNIHVATNSYANINIGSIINHHNFAATTFIWTQYGGTVDVGDITLNTSLFSYQLQGGTFALTGSITGGTNMLINIAGGTLVVTNSVFEDLVVNGMVQANGTAVNSSNASSLLSLDSTTSPGNVVVTLGSTQQACNPVPAYSVTYASTTADLSWLAGQNTLSHDVYFGTSLSAVTNANRLDGDINGDGSVDIDDLIALAQNWLNGTDLDDFAVLAADWGQNGDPEFKGNQTNTTHDPGTLSNGTYYWRIDEVKAGSTITGTVWSFSVGTEPTFPVVLNPSFEYPDVSGYQYAPAGTDWDHTGAGFVIADEGFYITTGTGTSPCDGDQILILKNVVSISQDISGFMPGHSYKVSWAEADDNNNSIRVSIDSTVIWDATPVTNNDWVVQTSDTFVATDTTHTLTIEGTNKFNMSDATVLIDSIGIVEVNVAPTAASDPFPANGASNLPADTVVLSWTAGAGATSHNVYFGTDPSPDNDTGSSEFQGNQPSTIFNPGSLNGNTTYYWQVDEVNDYGTTTGTVWSFTTSASRLTADQFPILPWSEPWRWWGPADSQQVFDEIYDCGFNIADFVTPSGLDIANAAGLKAIVFDDSNNHVIDSWASMSLSDVQQRVSNAVNSYGSHPALFAYYLRDEPGAGVFSTLQKFVSEFRAADPYHMSYVNLFPNYASSTQLGTSSYQTYVDSFKTTVQADFISYDHYAMNSDGTVDSAYWTNLATIRTAAQNSGVPFWNIVCAVQRSGWPTPSPATLRFQLYTSLAYGAEGIGWYMYFNWSDGLGVDFSLAPIDQYGNKTNTWYYLEDVNAAMHMIGSTYITLNNIGYHHSGTPSGWSVSGSNYLVGNFTQNGTGQSYIMLVNKSLSSSASYGVSSSYGQVYYVSPSDGLTYQLSGTLTLAPGEGRLLIAQ